MPDSDPPQTPNWADYIDSLHVFNPHWLVRARRASQAPRSAEGALGQPLRGADERLEDRPATER